MWKPTLLAADMRAVARVTPDPPGRRLGIAALQRDDVRPASPLAARGHVPTRCRRWPARTSPPQRFTRVGEAAGRIVAAVPVAFVDEAHPGASPPTPYVMTRGVADQADVRRRSRTVMSTGATDGPTCATARSPPTASRARSRHEMCARRDERVGEHYFEGWVSASADQRARRNSD